MNNNKTKETDSRQTNLNKIKKKFFLMAGVVRGWEFLVYQFSFMTFIVFNTQLLLSLQNNTSFRVLARYHRWYRIQILWNKKETYLQSMKTLLRISKSLKLSCRKQTYVKLEDFIFIQSKMEFLKLKVIKYL